MYDMTQINGIYFIIIHDVEVGVVVASPRMENICMSKSAIWKVCGQFLSLVSMLSLQEKEEGS